MSDRPLVVDLFSGGWHPRHPRQPSGPEPDSLAEQKALEAAGFDVEIIASYGWPWNPAARMHSAFRGVDPLRSLRVLLTRRRAAIIRAHMESALVPLLLRRAFGFRPPIVIWEVPWSPGWAYRERVGRIAIPRADRVVVFSTNQVDLIRDIYTENVRSVFVPFYVDVDFFKPQTQSYNVNSFILSSGLDSGRDFDIILRVSKEIRGQFKIKAANFSGYLTRDKYPNVEFITEYLPYSKFRGLYNDASIVVVSTVSTPNACGVTSLMEAMAMGKPTIVSDNPALRDYLPTPDAGVVVPIGDDNALRAAILDLQNNPEKAIAMGKRARAFAERRFNPDVNLKVLTDLFWEVLGEAGTAIRLPATDDRGTV